MNKMNTVNYNTFWRIIKDNRIEIPTIQRDYAYGRKSAVSIRVKLIADIVNSVTEQRHINLDFVYGKLLGKENQVSLERNRSNIQSLLKTIKSYASELNVEMVFDVTKQDSLALSNIAFIPLDGQQRLTTLYLVHWYIAQRNKDTESLNIIKRFSYSTRISSKDFCLMLCNSVFNLDSSTVSASEVICNHEDYFSFWEKDPTVKSMLVVIDEIHKKFNSRTSNYSECWKSLTESDTITFDFFDLEDFELTDELYIKMNARGKQLTNFENFKAWLIKEYSNLILVVEWKKKFDIQWTDLFWRGKEKSNHTIDSEYLQFFKILFLADYMKSQNVNEAGMDDDSALEDYESDAFNPDDFKSVVGVLRKKDANPIDIFQNSTLFKDNIDDYVGVLDLLSFDLDSPTTNAMLEKYIAANLSKLFFGEKLNKLTWWDTAFHYSISRYLYKLQKNILDFNQWVRIISNLIYNTRIDTPKLFIDAIVSIDSLINKMDNTQSVYLVFSKLQEDDIPFFSINQKKEEILKSKLILSDSNWESVLVEAENHKYFYGQIGFILNMCGTQISIKSFKDTFNRVGALFSEEVLSNNENLLSRSLLSLGDCFYKEGDNRLFNSNVRGTLRNRTENWRKFFDKYPDFIKKIIDHPKFNEMNIVSSLNDIIGIELPKVKNEYFSKFVENPDLFTYPKKHVIRKYDANYYLLNSTRISGYFVELYTYDWYLVNEVSLKQQFPDFDISYSAMKGEDNEPSLLIKSATNEYRIERNYKTGKFQLFSGISTTDFETIDDAINSVNNISYANPN